MTRKLDFERTLKLLLLTSLLCFRIHFLLIEHLYKLRVIGVEHKIENELMDSDDISRDGT